MKNYRRLSDREIKKMEFYKKSRKTAKKGIKWWCIITAIFLIFIVGIVVFYKTIDSTNGQIQNENLTAVNSGTDPVENDTAGLNEAEKQELKRESEKSKTIENSEKTKEPKKTENSDITGIKHTYDFSEWNKSCPRELVVINRDNPSPSDFQVKTKSCRGREVAIEAADDLEQMIVDAKRENIVLWLSSGYRNMDLQTRLFNRQVEVEKSRDLISQEEAEKRAQKVQARPGCSEHNTGLAIDFNGVEDSFYTTKEYKWLMDNAHKYGFIERYQKKWINHTGVIYEPWHFRYVGKEKALLIRDSGLSLEEYVIKKLIK